MTDHVAGPNTPASSPSLAELHRLCDEDYKAGAPSRGHNHRDDADRLTHFSGQQDEPSDLAVAVLVVQRMLTTYADVDHGDPHTLSRAHNAVIESVRILLHALGAELLADEDDAVRRSVDAQFPAVAAFLATERGDAQ